MFLNVHSYFSFRYGTLSPEALVELAFKNGYRSLALTDINNTSGVIDFVIACKSHDIKPVVGIDFRNHEGQCFTAIAKNNEGFYEINKFLSELNEKNELPPSKAPQFHDAFVIYPYHNKDYDLNENEFIGIPPDKINVVRFSNLSREKLLFLPELTFIDKKGYNTHVLLRAIDENVVLSKLKYRKQTGPYDFTFSRSQLYSKYRGVEFLLDNSERLIESCSFGLELKKNKNKKTFTGSQSEDQELLRSKTYAGFQNRYPKRNKAILERLKKELDMIHELGFDAYFLINDDIIAYATKKGYFHVGRGSGANSMVAYCLGITDVDPMELDLYFERFINPFRNVPPDFDIDFSWKDRDDVTRYIFERHGKEHTALLATYSTFKGRSVVRELGKVYGLPKAEIDSIVDYFTKGADFSGIDHIAKQIAYYAGIIQGFPNHLSVHAGGILISERPIYYYTATNLPPKNFPITQFSMYEAEDIGLYKFDILSQRGLGHIRESIQIIQENRGEKIDIHDIAKFKQDKRIKHMLRNGQTLGCFYVESPAMRQLLRKLKGDSYESLVAASSIIRPGVASSGMMKEYIFRFNHPDKFEYIHPKMKEILGDTFGVMVYQEDVIKVAHHFAGLSLSEADVLRRGMSGKYRSKKEFDRVAEQYFINCRKKGYDEKIIHEVWRQIKSFAGYSFAKGHSASYAVESYQSLFLKAYFPLDFMVGVINNFGGFYRTEIYLHAARMFGGKIHNPCVNRSNYLTSISDNDIWIGFIHIDEFQENLGQSIVQERQQNGPFSDFEDFLARINAGLQQIIILIRSGALRFTGKSKKELLWMAHLFLNKKNNRPKNSLFGSKRKKMEFPDLQESPFDNVFDEIELLGFPVSKTWFELLEKPLDKHNCSKHQIKPENIGKNIFLTGYLVTTKNTRTIKGDHMFFGTFLDKDGYFFDTTHFPVIAKKFPFRGIGCYDVKGKIADDFGCLSIEVTSMIKRSMVADPNYN